MNDESKLKLYVWPEFCPDYSDGLAFAVAHNQEEAMKWVRKVYGKDPRDWGYVEIHELDQPIARAVHGGA